MIGYHYTAWDNWKNIKEFGLVPSVIYKPEINIYFDKPVKGIWVWAVSPVGESELGSLIFQLVKHNHTKIVKLKVEYSNKDVLYRGLNKVVILHDGTIVIDDHKWQYHENQKSFIIENSIPPKNIKLLKTYNLMDIIK